MTPLFHDQVAIVTGAGSGIGRAHAMALAAAGASVVVADHGVALDGSGKSADSATQVANEITTAGGLAIAEQVDVTNETDVGSMVRRTQERFGRIDVLINNAGILRDRTFSKMSVDDFRSVFDVHVMGAFHCTHAVWAIMSEQNYGRILLTASASGLYGNYGQANYGAAKMALIGLMNTLHLEGERFDIRVNTLSPIAATRMTENLLPSQLREAMAPEKIAPMALWLVSECAPSKVIAEAGAGVMARAFIAESACVPMPGPATLAAEFDTLHPGDTPPNSGAAQTQKMLMRLAAGGSKRKA
ncbi:MAG: SDR family NAD(P)-dependent oxidoreductase [Gammaproteobacteria bacterium]